MSSAFSLSFYTRLGKNKKDKNRNKNKIFLSYMRGDFDYAKQIIDLVLNNSDSIIYYVDYDEYPEFDQNELNRLIGQTSVVLFAVSDKYLTTENDSYKFEYPFVKENSIPFLPIVSGESLIDEYTKKFGTIQYLNINQEDKTQIDVNKKIKDYLSHFVAKEKDFLIAEGAFKKKIFLSYRKKDRIQALNLIDLIHSDESCRDIAIWYDEFLVIGKEFDTSIFEKLHDSDGLLILITPNVVNEDNYVKSTEYPKAQEEGKTIIPYLSMEVDQKELHKGFKNLPEIVDEKNIAKTISDLFSSKVIKLTPKKKYALGLAYLYGIDVEINRRIALEFLSNSADDGYLPAINLLSDIYFTGNGVVKNLFKAKEYSNRLIELYKKNVDYSIFDWNAYAYVNEVLYSTDVGVMIDVSYTDIKDQYLEILKELNKYRHIDEDVCPYYLELKITITKTLLLLGIGNIEDIKNTLEELKKVDIKKYNSCYLHYFMACIHAGYELDEHKGKAVELFKTVLNNAFEADETYACNAIAADFNMIDGSQYLNVEEKIKIFEECITTIENCSRKEAYENFLLILKSVLIETKVCSHVYKNDDSALDEEIKLLGQYRKLSSNDPTLLNRYAAIQARFNLSDRNSKAIESLIRSELLLMDEIAFENPLVSGLRFRMMLNDLEKDESLSNDEKINRAKELFNEAKRKNDHLTAFSLNVKFLFPSCIMNNDVIGAKELYEHLKECPISQVNLLEFRFRYKLFIACISDEYSIEDIFNELVLEPKFKENKSDAEYLYFICSSVFNCIKDFNRKDDRFKRNGLCLFDLLFNYLNEVKINDVKVRLFLYPTVLNLYFEMAMSYQLYQENVDKVVEKYAEVSRLYRTYLGFKDDNDQLTANITKTFLKMVMEYIIYSYNKGLPYNETIFGLFPEIVKMSIDTVDKSLFKIEDIYRYGTIAYIIGKNSQIYELFSHFSYSFMTKDKIPELGSYYHYLFVDRLEKDEETKAILLMDYCFTIRKLYSNNPNYVLIFFSCIIYRIGNYLLKLKQYILLKKYHELMLENLGSDSVDYPLYNMLSSFLFFDNAITPVDDFTPREKKPYSEIENKFAYQAILNKDLFSSNRAYFNHVPNEIKRSPLLLNLETINRYSEIAVNNPNLDYSEFFDGVISDLYKIYDIDVKENKNTHAWVAVTDLFNNANDVFKGNMPLWLKKANCEYGFFVIHEKYCENNNEKILEMFNKVLAHIGEIRPEWDLSVYFAPVIGYVISATPKEDVERINNLMGFGFRYYHFHKNEYSEAYFWMMFHAIYLKTKFEIAGLMSIILNPDKSTCVGENVFDELYEFHKKNNNAIDDGLDYLFKKIEYMNSVTDPEYKAHYLKCYPATYQKIIDEYEKRGDTEEAYKYQEILRAFKSKHNLQ